MRGKADNILYSKISLKNKTIEKEKLQKRIQNKPLIRELKKKRKIVAISYSIIAALTNDLHKRLAADNTQIHHQILLGIIWRIMQKLPIEDKLPEKELYQELDKRLNKEGLITEEELKTVFQIEDIIPPLEKWLKSINKEGQQINQEIKRLEV